MSHNMQQEQPVRASSIMISPVRQAGTWIFRREFEHARVTVDLEKREGAIRWLSD